MKRYIILLLMALFFVLCAAASAEGVGFDYSLLGELRLAHAYVDGIYDAVVCVSADGALSTVMVADGDAYALYIAQGGLSAEADVPLIRLLEDVPYGELYGAAYENVQLRSFAAAGAAELMQTAIADGAIDENEIVKLRALEWTELGKLVWNQAGALELDGQAASRRLAQALGGIDRECAVICADCSGLGCEKCGYDGWWNAHDIEGNCVGEAVCAVCGAEMDDPVYYGDNHAGDEYPGGEYCEKCHPEHMGGTATCASPAVCEVCDNPYGDLDADNHVNTALSGAVKPGCEIDGYTGDTVCADCGDVIVSGAAIPATGHAFSLTGKTGDAHTYKCINCNSVIKEAHSGGTADCVSRALCKVCGGEYGSLDASAHAGKLYSKTEYCNACHPTHSGGTATCTSAAKCEVCGWTYGSADGANHAGRIYAGTAYCSSCHIGHGGGAPTCVHGAFCEICGAEYGAIDSFNHAGSVYPGRDECTRCHTAHTGGMATCASGALCGICGAEYGARSSSNHAGTIYVGTNACSACHLSHTGGVATCVSLAQCSVCYSAYGSVNGKNHAGSVYEGTNYCALCHPSHTGSAATCVSPAECSVCGIEFAPIDRRNHAGAMYNGVDECSACHSTHTLTPATCIQPSSCSVCRGEFGYENSQNHIGETVSGYVYCTACCPGHDYYEGVCVNCGNADASGQTDE